MLCLERLKLTLSTEDFAIWNKWPKHDKTMQPILDYLHDSLKLKVLTFVLSSHSKKKGQVKLSEVLEQQFTQRSKHVNLIFQGSKAREFRFDTSKKKLK